MSKFYEESEISKDMESKVRKMATVVFGYGNQGRAQALNLRDSGFRVTVANVDDDYAKAAASDGFEVLSLEEGASRCDIGLLLLPDEVADTVYLKSIAPNLRQGSTLVFASGYNIFYGRIKPDRSLDVLLVAPRMIGAGVRSLCAAHKGFPVLAAVHQAATDSAEQVMLALCAGIGAFNPGGCVLRSSFREETLTDLMGEQAVAGSILYLVKAVYGKLVERGVSPEAALLELYASGEYVEVFSKAAEIGLWGQLRLHSHTSQYGQQTRGPRIVNERTDEILSEILDEIESGEFASEWSKEMGSGLTRFRELWDANMRSEMLSHERSLYTRLGRRPSG